MAKACAREMVLGETSDEATGSSGDVANQHEICSDNPRRQHGDGYIGSSRCGRDTRAMTVAVAMAMAAAVAIVAVIAMVLAMAMAVAMVLATAMTMAIVMVLAIVVVAAMAIAVPDHPQYPMPHSGHTQPTTPHKIQCSPLQFKRCNDSQ